MASIPDCEHHGARTSQPSFLLWFLINAKSMLNVSLPQFQVHSIIFIFHPFTSPGTFENVGRSDCRLQEREREVCFKKCVGGWLSTSFRHQSGIAWIQLQMPGMNLQLSLVCRWPSALWVPSLWHHWCATHIRTKRRASWSTQVWNLVQKWCWSSCHDYSPILLWSVYRIRVGHKDNLSSLQLIIWQHRWHLNVGIGRSVRIASWQVGAMTLGF